MTTVYASRAKRGQLIYASLLVTAVAPCDAAAPWEPFPASTPTSDFGGVGLIQTPSARFAPDGQMSVGANHVQPYDRYYLTIQGMPWLEASLRLTTVRNRLYSPFPDFSGTQSFKDRGFDLKLRVLDEGSWYPAVAFGMRDFVGTGLFSSEYVVANKAAGPLDFSLGVGWGNIASRGLLPNPFRLISSRFDTRDTFVSGGGSLNTSYFKGRDIALFGGVKYDTPIKGLTLKAEYDSNDYQDEALGNRFRVRLPVNFGVDYAARSWLRLGASYERGRKLGLSLTFTSNFNQPFRIPKFDLPATPVAELRPDEKLKAQSSATTTEGAEPPLAATVNLSAATTPSPPVRPGEAVETPVVTDKQKLALYQALNLQGAGLYSADFLEHEVTLYVAQSRFQNMATGLGRVARAAFAALPERFAAVRIVFVENGMETIAVRVYRSSLIDALTPGRGSPAELLGRTDFSTPPLGLREANYQSPLGKAPPRFFYSIRPFLKTTLGRPEQFILYEAGARFNGFAQINRHLNVAGSIAVNLSDNFDKLRIPSNSTLPHVRSDIKDYLAQGKTSLSYLNANYVFNVAPSIYGHVFAGLLEEMYGGAGGEVLFRPSTSNWAIGANIAWVKKRDFDQRFDFLGYQTVTGFVTGAYHIPGSNLDLKLSVGRYLAKDRGATFEISRTFDSGVVVGAFATKTNVSAADFGEGRFDKGLYISIPLDAIYTRHVRGSVGVAYRPLIRDGGQMVVIPQPLLGTTDDMLKSKFVRDWPGLGK